MSGPSSAVLRAIEDRRVAEKEQALFYRALAAEAEARGDEALAERLHGLHADEQHHLSRLTARLVELGAIPADLVAVRSSSAALEGWEGVARDRERAEARGYEELLGEALDERTRALFAETLEVERHHERELGGKWTMA